MATEAKQKDRVTPLYFDGLETNGSNFLDWHVNMRTYLSAENLDYTLNRHSEEEIEAVYK